MATLAQMKCEACEPGSPTVTAAEQAEFLQQLPEWRVVERDGMNHLERVFRFSTFGEALDFTNKVGALAEAEGHHPALLTEWGKVTVAWWTHSIGGLHRNDFIMAAKSDAIYDGGATH